MKKGIVEIFAGIAGLAQGFAESSKDFYIQGLLDIDESAKRSFLFNFPTTNYIQEDIQNIAPHTFLDLIGGERPYLFLGCPPCQGLSAAGKRNSNDPRNKLIYNYFDYIKFLNPKVFILENVPQVLSIKKYNELITAFAKEQKYNICSGVLNCALYGLPQTRQRAVVIGFQKSMGVVPTFPRPTHYGKSKVFSYATGEVLSTDKIDAYEQALGWYATVGQPKVDDDFIERLKTLPPMVNLQDALDDLPIASEDVSKYDEKVHAQTGYQKMMREGSIRLTGHAAWGHSDDMVRRMRGILEGGSQRSESYFSQAYGRLHRAGLARTITGNFHNPGSGRYIHYREHRTLTIREAARLQGFEDSFEFLGTPTDQRRIIGNAFPKRLSVAVAKHVLSQL